MKNVKIIGTGQFIPRVVTNSEFFDVFGRKAKLLSNKIPHKERYLSAKIDTGEIIYSTVDMSVIAAEMAIENANISKDEIDMIIFSSATPDYLLPPGFVMIQSRLGIKKISGFDIRSGCAGFGTALVQAVTSIKCGCAKKVLVIGSDNFSSRVVNLNFSPEKMPLKILFNYMLFGDGAGAIILSETESFDEGIIDYQIISENADLPDGSNIKIGGGVHPYLTETISTEDVPIFQDPYLSEEWLPKIFIKSLNDFLEKNEGKISDFDYFFVPVGKESFTQKIKNAFPELPLDRCLTVGNKGGALLNAAIPMAITEYIQNGTIQKGDKIIIYAAENTRWQHVIISLII